MIDRRDWQEIFKAIEKFSRTPNTIVTSKVVKVDEARRVIWVEDMRETEIPIYGFELEIKNSITPSGGSSSPYSLTQIVALRLPKVGQQALILKPQGSRAAPKCIGVDLQRGIANAV